MTERTGANAQALTGVWHGLYTYRTGESVSFVATLIETGRFLGGSTDEPGIMGSSVGAILSGSRQQNAVDFVKTYQGADPYAPVDYEGTLSHDGTEIEGRWTIRGSESGTFLMIRSIGASETVSRAEVARV